MRRVILLIILASLASLASLACSKKKSSSDDGSGDNGSVSSAGTVNANSSGAGSTTVQQSSGSGSTVTATPYQTSNTPGTIALQVPGSLSSKPAATSLRLTDDTSAAADSSQAEGYVKLVEKTSQIPPLVADLSEKLFELDSVLPQTALDCVNRLGTTWTTCTTPAVVTSTFTDKMYSGVLAAVGINALAQADKDALQAKIGQSVTLGVLTVSKLTNDPSGYTSCVLIKVDDQNSTEYCFNSKDMRVTDQFEETTTSTDAAGKEIKTKDTGTHALAYVADQQLFTLVDDYSSGASSYTDHFTMKRNKDSAAANAIIFHAQIKDQVEHYGSYSTDQNGLADDDGGFVVTKYTWDAAVVDSLHLSGPTSIDTTYGMFPTSDPVTVDTFNNALGFVYGAGPGGKDQFEYTGPVPAPTGMKLWKWGYDGDGNPAVSDSGLTVTSLGTAEQSLFYDEEFTKGGTLAYWCYHDTQAGACTGGSGTSGAYAAAYTKIASDAGTELHPVTITLSGSGANEVAFRSGDYLVVPADYDLAAVSPTSDEWDAKALAYGSFGGDSAHLSATGLDGYTVYVYPPTAAAFANVHVYFFDYTVDGTSKFTLAPNVTVTAQ